MPEPETAAPAVEDAVSIEKRIEVKYREKFVEDVGKFKTELQTQNKAVIEKAIADFRKKMEPPSAEDIQKLLDQDYLEFHIKIPWPVKKGGKMTTTARTFTIRELPQAIEKKFYARLKDTLTPLASEVASLSLNLLEGDAARKIVSVLDAFEPLLDVIAYTASLCLNPYGEDEDVTEAWIRENMSSTRILKIVNAQIECNRMRDFFSLLSLK